MHVTRFLPVAILSLACLSTSLPAQNPASNGDTDRPQPSARATHAATRMMPAVVSLVDPLDGKKEQVGSVFHARILNTVKFDDGTEFPRGTILEGKVTDDDVKVEGRSRLVLRFERANLKNGQVVPIRATIVFARYGAQDEDPDATSSMLANLDTKHWSEGDLRVDQKDVIRGVDLHSSVTAGYSGAFVSSTDKDVHFAAGTQLALAIRPSDLH